MDCSMPGFPVLHLPKLAQTCPLSQWCHPTILSSVVPFSSCLQSFLASGSFLMNWLFTSGGQSFGASASVLPMNIQDWFPLGLTGLISLQSKGLSRVFSNTIVQKHQFFETWPSLWFHSHIHTWLLEKPFLLFSPSVMSESLRSHGPMSIQGWFPLRLTGLISLLSKGLSGVFSSTTVQKNQFFVALASLWSSSHNCSDYWEDHSFDLQTFAGKVMSLLFNMLCRFV